MARVRGGLRRFSVPLLLTPDHPLAPAGVPEPRRHAGRRPRPRPRCRWSRRRPKCPATALAGSRRPWPKTLPEQAQAVRAALAEHPAGLTPEAMARLFLRARTQTVTDLLNTLVSLGQARALDGGRYVPT